MQIIIPSTKQIFSPNSKSSSNWKKFGVIATVLSAVATVFIAVMTMLNTQNLSDQLMRFDSSLSLQRDALNNQIDAFNLQKKSFEQTIRPVLFVSEQKFIQNEGFYLSLTLKNTGSLPACDIRVTYKFSAKIDTPLFKIGFQKILGYKTVFPGMEASYSTDLSKIEPKKYFHLIIRYRYDSEREYIYTLVQVVDMDTFEFGNSPRNSSFKEIWQNSQ